MLQPSIPLQTLNITALDVCKCKENYDAKSNKIINILKEKFILNYFFQR